MRVIFMGTPGFAVPALQALIDSQHEVVAVYSQPPRPAGRGMKLTASPIQQLAEQHRIPVHTPTSLKSAEAQAAFAAHQADIAVVAAYGLLLPQPILDAPRFGCINIHPSDLPRWRGAAPLHRTIMAGDTTTACCIMQMDAGLDTGPVLARQNFSIPEGMTTGQLHDSMAHVGAQMVLEVLAAFAAGHVAPTPQVNAGATYAAKMTKADQPIDWGHAAPAIRQQILALAPTPGAITKIGDEIVKIFAARIEPGDASKAPGQVLDDQLLINTGSGEALRLLELQRAGKPRQPVSQFLQSLSVATGSLVGNV